MELSDINKLTFEACCDLLKQCCTSTDWVVDLAEKRPYKSIEDLLNKSDLAWYRIPEEGWLEACEGHPKIGDVNSLSKKYANTEEMASNEQSGMNKASMDVIKKLAEGNSIYENKFGYIFIVCATGKSAQEMLDLLNARLNNNSESELSIAKGEQNKITRLRLQKILS